MSGAPRFPGREVTLGGVAYTAAPLSLGAVRRLTPRIEKYAALPLLEQMDIGRDVLHASLARNHPDLTPDAVEELLDPQQARDLLGDVLKLSGFVGADQGNAQGPLDGTGTTSTPTLQPASDGPSITSSTASP